MSELPTTDAMAEAILGAYVEKIRGTIQKLTTRQAEVVAQLIAVTAERDSLKADAERYRWLRDFGSIRRPFQASTGSQQPGQQPHVIMTLPGVHPVSVVLHDRTMDAAIDAAIAALRQGDSA